MTDRPSRRRPRSRGEKAPLTQRAVVHAALECLQAGGADGLTMRAVAARLETGPSSLYAHVRDLEDLYRLVVNEAAEAALGTRVARDDEGAVTLLLAYGRALFEVPGAARLALLTTPTGPRSLDLLERLLSLLTASGRPLERATRTVDAAMLLVTGAVAEQDARRHAATIPSDLRDAAGDDASTRPLLSAALAAPDVHDGVEYMTWAVRAVLSGADSLDGATRPRRTKVKAAR